MGIDAHGFFVIENPAFDAGFHRRYAFDQKSSIA